MIHDKGYHNHPSPSAKLVAQKLELYVNRRIMIKTLQVTNHVTAIKLSV